MDILIIKDGAGEDYKMDLLPVADALNGLPSSLEVFELLEALNLEEQEGLVTLIMEQPGLRVAISRTMEALKLFGITMGALKHSNGRVIEANYLLEVERIKVALLLQETCNLQAGLTSQYELAAGQAATIMELQQQQLGLQQQLQQQQQQQEDDMSLPNTDASFLDEGLHGPQPAPARVQGAALALSRSRQAEAERKAQEMAAAAAAAQQEMTVMEAQLSDQEDAYENQLAMMRTEFQQAQILAAAAQQKASAEALHSEQLQEQLQHTKTSFSSVCAALTSEKEARARAERRVAQCKRAHAGQVSALAVLAQQQTGTKEALEEENTMLRSCVSALEQQLRHASGAGHLRSPTTTAHSTTSADLAAAASSGAGGTSAGTPEQSAFQAMEAEEEAISSGLPALEEQERRQSAPAELLLDGGSIADSNSTANPSTPADPAAAASSGAGGASAGAPEQSALQAMEAEEEAISSGLPALEEQERRQSAPAELLLDGGSIADSSPTQTSSTPADPAAAASPGNGGASAGSPEQSPSQEPSGLLSAVLVELCCKGPDPDFLRCGALRGAW
ncbi:g6129 [Coccomyxa viridis]|uniref:G6129 protein n=1 Tax=Coccomyxa viridis TaxID=1274662 RepID=A0ABP1G1B0_9CHLO